MTTNNTTLIPFRRHILTSDNPLYRPYYQPSLKRYYSSFFDLWQPNYQDAKYPEAIYQNKENIGKKQIKIIPILLIILLLILLLLKLFYYER